MTYAYLICLIISIVGLGLADYRYKIALFFDRNRTLKVIALSVAFFLFWDLAGVNLDIFFVGESKFLSGFRILPEVPIEEIFFLILLSYNSLLVWRKVADE